MGRFSSRRYGYTYFSCSQEGVGDRLVSFQFSLVQRSLAENVGPLLMCDCSRDCSLTPLTIKGF